MGLIKFIKEEIQVVQERDPAIKSPIEVILYPTFRVMLSYRRAHRLYQKVTIVSAMLFCYIRQFYIAGRNLHGEDWPFVIGVVAVTMAGVYYTLTCKIGKIE